MDIIQRETKLDDNASLQLDGERPFLAVLVPIASLTGLFDVVGLYAAHVGGLFGHEDVHQLVQALLELGADSLWHLLTLQLGCRENLLQARTKRKGDVLGPSE